jgi:hypothetical protein
MELLVNNQIRLNARDADSGTLLATGSTKNEFSGERRMSICGPQIRF